MILAVGGSLVSIAAAAGGWNGVFLWVCGGGVGWHRGGRLVGKAGADFRTEIAIDLGHFGFWSFVLAWWEGKDVDGISFCLTTIQGMKEECERKAPSRSQRKREREAYNTASR